MSSSKSLLSVLKKIVVCAVKFLSILMTLVILWSVIDVVRALYNEVLAEPFMMLATDHLFNIFASFLTVLIAIEIFLNVIIYLTKEMFHVQLVVATALTAVIRKVIVLDYKVDNTPVIFAIAGLVFAVAVAYWIVTKSKGDSSKKDIDVI